MVSNTFAKSIGLGGSARIKGKSISNGGGCHCKPDHSGDQGSLKAARPGTERTYHHRPVNPGSGAKGNGGSIQKSPTVRDPLQKGGKILRREFEGCARLSQRIRGSL